MSTGSQTEEELFSSTIDINITKSLTTEYNENVSTKFIQYVKDEDFDQETLQSDICDDEELENCSIAIHLIDEFPTIFNTTDSQQKLLFILKTIVKGESIEKQSLIKIIFYDNAGQINYNKGIIKSFASDSTLKLIAQHFEDEMEMKDNNNPPKVHIWLRFGQIKSIYTSSNFNITLNDLKYQNHIQWVEIPDDYLSEFKLNQVFNDSLQYENLILIERKQPNNIWPSAKRGDWRNNVQIGDIVDVKNTKKNNRWYEALIRYLYPDGHESANFAIIHYIGLSAKYDEKIYIYDDLSIKKRHTYSTGPYRKPAITNGDTVGIVNSKNTSFMSSVIQPLARSPQLTDFFLNDEYLNQINKTNPLGWKGRVAELWGTLIHDIFSGKTQAIDITNFQATIEKFAPRCSGYGKQDSYDFLSFLLDGLHEDLNQIHNKPFTEVVPDDGRPSDIVAAEHWNSYLRRNQSEVNDIFHFQCEQYHQCETCGNESVRFDTKNVLSLEIPNCNKQIIQYTWIDCGTFIEPKKNAVQTAMDANISLLKDMIAEKHKVPKEELFICEIVDNTICRQFKNSDQMFECMNTQKNDVFIYNVPKPSMNKDCVQKAKYQTFMVNNKRTTSTSDMFIGFPLLITLSSNRIYSYRQIRYELWHLLKPYLYDKINIENNALPFKFTASWDYGSVEIADKEDKFEFLHTNNLKFEINWNDSQQYNVHPYYPTETKYDDDYSRLQNGNESIELSQCFELYNAEKVLSDNDAFYCSECKDFTMKTQITNVWSCSDVFIIRFERFIEHESHREIVNTKINFPLSELNLSSYIKCHDAKRDALYDCYGISIYSSGHWSSYAKSLYNYEWYYFDDKKVERINDPYSHKSFNKNDVHILYYYKQKPRDIKYTCDSVGVFEYKVTY